MQALCCIASRRRRFKGRRFRLLNGQGCRPIRHEWGRRESRRNVSARCDRTNDQIERPTRSPRHECIDLYAVVGATRAALSLNVEAPPAKVSSNRSRYAETEDGDGPDQDTSRLWFIARFAVEFPAGYFDVTTARDDFDNRFSRCKYLGYCCPVGSIIVDDGTAAFASNVADWVWRACGAAERKDWQPAVHVTPLVTQSRLHT